MKVLIIVCLCVALLSAGTLAQRRSTVSVNLDCEKNVGGVSTFNRAAFITMHYGIRKEKLDKQGLNELLGRLQISLGRQFTGPHASLPSFRSRPSLDKMRREGQKEIAELRKKESFRVYSSRNTVVSDKFQAYTEARGRFKAYGQHCVRHFRTHYDPRRRVPLPEYFEPLNEAFNAAYKLPGNPIATYKDISRMLNAVCRQVKEGLRGQVQTVGYGSGWVEYNLRDLAVFEERLKNFIDIAGQCIDGWSLHPYDSIMSDGTYLDIRGSKLDAVIDLIDTYSVARHGVIKPILITEYGATSKFWQVPTGETKVSAPYSTSRDWKILHSISSLMMQFIGRADRIKKAVAFTTARAEWNYERSKHPFPWAMYRRVRGEWRHTHLIKIYRMWLNVRGDYRSSTSTDRNVLVHSMTNKRKAFIILKNIIEEPVTINFRIENRTPISRVSLRRLYLQEGRDREGSRQGIRRTGVPRMTVGRVSNNFAPITLKPEEMVVYDVDLMAANHPTMKIEEVFYYSRQFADGIEAGKRNQYSINGVDLKRIDEVYLRVSMSRPMNRRRRFTVIANGVKVKGKARTYGPAQRGRESYWNLYEVRLPLRLLRERNTFRILFDDSGGHITTVALRGQKIYSEAPPPIPPRPEIFNSLRNGNFGNKLKNWRRRGVVTRIGGRNAYAGSSSVRIPENGFGMLSQSVSVKKRTSYSLTCFAEARGSRRGTFIRVSGCNGKVSVRERVAQASWQRETLRFNTGDCNVVTIALYANSGRGGSFDNVRLDQGAVMSIESDRVRNLLGNPEFENGIRAWTAEGASGTTSALQKSGTTCGRLERGRLVQLVEVQPNTEYLLSSYLRVKDDGMRAEFGVTGRGNETHIVQVDAPHWMKHTLYFKSGAESSVRVFAGASGRNLGYMDTVRLVPLDSVDDVLITSVPESLPRDSQFQVTLSYVALVRRDVIIVLRDAVSEKWIGETRSQTPAGRGSINLDLSAAEKQQMIPGASYKIMAELRTRLTGTNGRKSTDSIVLTAQ